MLNPKKCFVMRRFQPLFLAALLALSATSSAAAQDRADASEYDAVVSAMRTVVAILHDATTRHAAEPISDQLRSMSLKLNDAAPATGGFRGPTRDTGDLIAILKDVRRELESMARTTSDRELAIRLYDMVDELDEALALAEDEPVVYTERPSADYYPEGGYENGRRTRVYSGSAKDRRGRKDRRDRNEWWDRDWDMEWDRGWSGGRVSSAGFVGESNSRWPFSERSTYRMSPAVRYNRVDGFVLGVAQDPLSWTNRDRGRIYGQGGYAFGLDDWRYEIGAETRLGSRRSPVDVKIGGGYHQNTETNDLWKSNWVENSLASFIFRSDFFDYYETEGWTMYAVSRITKYLQASVAYRADAYRSLQKNVSWSVFEGDGFRVNPTIVEGDMQSLVLALEGGSIRALNWRPKGVAFRLEAEIGQGFGGDFDFSRYVGDVRGYARFSPAAGGSLRLRGGFTEGTVPVQKAFTLGGVGSMRAYPQNVYTGTRMLLANAELELYEPDVIEWLLNDMTLLGLFDAGWTNSSGANSFSWDDVIPSAGFGLALDDRNLRFELAWPLRDMGTGRQPTLWLRLNPTF